MKWQELSLQVPMEYVEPVSYLFGRYGRGLSMQNVTPDQVLLCTYLPTTSKQRRARIEVGINLIRLLQPLGDLEVKDLEEADWETAWKAHFTLLKVGKKLVVKPSWIDYDPTPKEVVIELDPGMAFGTGYHPTTQMCLEALEDEVSSGMQLVDLGTGSGILTIASLRLGAARAVAIDIDPIAIQTARKNFQASYLKDKVSLARGSLPNRAATAESFDLATANISGKIIAERAAGLFQVLKPGGKLIASGFLETQQGDVIAALNNAGFALDRTMATDDWVVLVLSKSVKARS